MFLFIHDCCFGRRFHGTVDVIAHFRMISVADFTAIDKATGESLQDITLLFFHTVNYHYYFAGDKYLY